MTDTVQIGEANTPFEKLPGTQITYRGKISIAPAAPSVPHFPRFRALALFGRRPQERVDSVVIPASKNLHRSRSRTKQPLGHHRPDMRPIGVAGKIGACSQRHVVRPRQATAQPDETW
jgi:hypothetical protein